MILSFTNSLNLFKFPSSSLLTCTIGFSCIMSGISIIISSSSSLLSLCLFYPWFLLSHSPGTTPSNLSPFPQFGLCPLITILLLYFFFWLPPTSFILSSSLIPLQHEYAFFHIILYFIWLYWVVAPFPLTSVIFSFTSGLFNFFLNFTLSVFTILKNPTLNYVLY